MARGSGTDLSSKAWHSLLLELEKDYPDCTGRIRILVHDRDGWISIDRDIRKFIQARRYLSHRQAHAFFPRRYSRELLVPPYSTNSWRRTRNGRSYIIISVRGHQVLVVGTVPSVDAQRDIVERLRQMPGIRNVLDELVVAAPSLQASPSSSEYLEPYLLDDLNTAYALEAASRPDEGTRIVRHPSIQAHGPAIEGHSLRITIDLALEPDQETRSEGFQISDLDEDWSTIPIRVELLCADMTFDKGANVGTIIVRRNKRSIPVTVEGLVGKISAGRDLIHIRAVFDLKNRHCGDAERSVVIQRQQVSVPKSVGLTVGWSEIDESRLPADMTIRIVSLKVNNIYSWTSMTHVVGGPAERSCNITLGQNSREFAAQLRAQAVRLEPGRHENTLKGFGQKIWSITPPEFKELYWLVRSRLGANFSIQIVTDEPDIHWELMQPVHSATQQVADHLMLDHPVARWVKQAEGFLRVRPISHEARPSRRTRIMTAAA
ncbi:hypothetical protein [Methylobacterium sp. Leaf125]|uniref:hypothetical protein n=1 Tax=Methylobacterium sp. Leaf125 TaxID=1736265 RepID=UPI000AEA7B56|nr:hypothetical protein [Methylobacterium sp. Leaf125]